MSNKDLLALYGINLVKELKSGSSLILKNNDTESRMSSALFEKLISAANDAATQFPKLPKISFGVEFEFVGDSTYIEELDAKMRELFHDDYINAFAYRHNNGKCWILGKDSSIDISESDLTIPCNYELSTPKLKLSSKKDIDLLRQVIELVKTVLHGEVNSSCGTHVHIGLPINDMTLTKVDLKNLLTVYSSIESRVFDPLVPKSRRRNKFCKKTEPWLDKKYQKLSTRYCTFNYSNEEVKCDKLHLECRQLEGTLDVDLVLAWLLLQVNIILDVLNAIKTDNLRYLNELSDRNAFDVLFKYDFSSDIINLFIDRIIRFKSRSIQSNV